MSMASIRPRCFLRNRVRRPRKLKPVTARNNSAPMANKSSTMVSNSFIFLTMPIKPMAVAQTPAMPLATESMVNRWVRMFVVVLAFQGSCLPGSKKRGGESNGRLLEAHLDHADVQIAVGLPRIAAAVLACELRVEAGDDVVALEVARLLEALEQVVPLRCRRRAR